MESVAKRVVTSLDFVVAFAFVACATDATELCEIPNHHNPNIHELRNSQTYSYLDSSILCAKKKMP